MAEKDRTYRIIVSGGGTGGHIYPAIAIANQLKEKLEKVDILFVGAQGKMEMQKVPEAGYPIKGLWISGLQRSLSPKNLSFPFKVISSVSKAFKILKEFNPDIAVGFGGYASAPMLYAASKKGLPSVIQEQNSYAGITNKLLAKSVNKICVAHDKMERFFPEEKIILTGNPVRKGIENANSKREAGLQHFGLSGDNPVMFILGGSLGARTLNETMIAGLEQLKEAGVQVIWQCGKFYKEEMIQRTEGKLGDGIILTDFISDMDLAYAVSDVVVSRAGALSVSELCLVGKPVIFVPSPNVSEDHQTKNAMSLVEKGAALMVKDIDSVEQLIPASLELLHDKNKREELSKNILGLAMPNAAEDIADEIIELIK